MPFCLHARPHTLYCRAELLGIDDCRTHIACARGHDNETRGKRVRESIVGRVAVQHDRCPSPVHPSICSMTLNDLSTQKHHPECIPHTTLHNVLYSRQILYVEFIPVMKSIARLLGCDLPTSVSIRVFDQAVLGHKDDNRKEKPNVE